VSVRVVPMPKQPRALLDLIGDRGANLKDVVLQGLFVDTQTMQDPTARADAPIRRGSY